jgi:hypothetical protein
LKSKIAEKIYASRVAVDNILDTDYNASLGMLEHFAPVLEKRLYFNTIIRNLQEKMAPSRRLKEKSQRIARISTDLFNNHIGCRTSLAFLGLKPQKCCFFRGSCSETEVSEQLYSLFRQ